MRLILLAVLAAGVGILVGCGSKAPAPTTAASSNSPPATIDTPPGSTAPSPPSSPGKSKLKIEIAMGKLSVNGKVVPIPGELSEFEKAFGKPSGITQDPVSDTHQYIFWRELGIRGRRTTEGKKNVQEILFSFEPLYDLSAKSLSQPFSEDLYVEGQLITRTTKFDEVQKINPGNRGNLSFGTWTIGYSDPDLRVRLTPGENGMRFVSAEQPPFAR